MKRVLVTGATGFIGRRVLRRLLGRPVDVRVLVRDPQRLPPHPSPSLDIVLGSLGDDSAIERAVEGVDHVLHLAALATACARCEEDYARQNADAVEHLLAACARHGVRRFVHVSSILARPPAATASAWGFRSRGASAYARSKAAAERMVARYAAAGRDAVVVRPTRVYGPGPWNDANGATRLAVMYIRGTFRLRLADADVQANWVHVDDVAEGILRAADHGRAGAVYELGGQNASVREYLDHVADAAGVRRVTIPVPPLLLLGPAYICEAWGRLGGRCSLTPDWLTSFLEHRPVNSAAARSDLRYRPRPLAAGLCDTLAWVRRQQKGPWHVGSRRHA